MKNRGKGSALGLWRRKSGDDAIVTAGGAASGEAKTREPRRALGENTRRTGGANGMKTHNESGGALSGRAKTERRAVSSGEMARTAAPLNEEAKRKTATKIRTTRAAAHDSEEEKKTLGAATLACSQNETEPAARFGTSYSEN
jgi:hypothetical protein